MVLNVLLKSNGGEMYHQVNDILCKYYVVIKYRTPYYDNSICHDIKLVLQIAFSIHHSSYNASSVNSMCLMQFSILSVDYKGTTVIEHILS